LSTRPPKPWDDLGSWLAGTISRRPTAWCGVALLLPPALIAGGTLAGFVGAGVCGAFAGRIARTGVGMRPLVAFAAFAVALAALVPDVHLSGAVPTLALLAVAFAAGRECTALPVLVGYSIAAAAVAFIVGGQSVMGWDRTHLALGIAAAGMLLMPGAARWERELRRFAIMAVALAVAYVTGGRRAPDRVLVVLGWASMVTALVDLLWFAGRELAEPDAAARGEAARVRVLVRMQRRPWITATTLVFIALGVRWWFQLNGLHTVLQPRGWLAFVTYPGVRIGWLLMLCSGALLYHARGYHRSSFEQLAPWIVPVFAALLFDAPMTLSFGETTYLDVFKEGLVTASLPFVGAFAAGALVDRLKPERGRLLVYVGLASAVALTGRADTSMVTMLGWGLVTGLVLHSLARMSGRMVVPVLLATVLGSVLGGPGPLVFSVPGNLTLVLVAAAFVAMMRQSRSLCAVPLDHPIIVDYAREPAVGAGRVLGG